MWDLPYNIPFQLALDCDDYSCREEHEQDCIKEVGVFPVYALESGLKLFGSKSSEIFYLEFITDIYCNESKPKAIRGGSSNNENGDCEQLLIALREDGDKYNFILV